MIAKIKNAYAAVANYLNEPAAVPEAQLARKVRTLEQKIAAVELAFKARNATDQIFSILPPANARRFAKVSLERAILTVKNEDLTLCAKFCALGSCALGVYNIATQGGTILPQYRPYAPVILIPPCALFGATVGYAGMRLRQVIFGDAPYVGAFFTQTRADEERRQLCAAFLDGALIGGAVGIANSVVLNILYGPQDLSRILAIPMCTFLGGVANCATRDYGQVQAQQLAALQKEEERGKVSARAADDLLWLQVWN
ncbi:MAG: hypothetical protein LBF24_00095 [Puniceicoccales bacterium]|jgi:hypothetical protein|nr:hypothetical protein [Puniceicoccales bacterium]